MVSSEAEKLANFAMSLKKGAAEFYSILSTRKEQDYEWLKNKFQHHYGGTDSATTNRYELLQMEQKEDESLEEYLARLQKMVVASFPDESKSEACSPFFVDAFMKGCRNKGVVLSAAEKHPKTLEKAYKYVLDATHLRKAILGKKHVKKVKPVEADSRMEMESLTSTSSSDSREIRGYHVKTGRFERKRFDESDKSDDHLEVYQLVFKRFCVGVSHILPTNTIIHHQDRVTAVASSVEILIILLEIVPEEGVIKTMITGGMMSDSIAEVIILTGDLHQATVRTGMMSDSIAEMIIRTGGQHQITDREEVFIRHRIVQ